MVLFHLEVVLHCFDWFGLVLRNGCRKENDGFSKEMLSKFIKTPVLVLAIG